jgi:hypothetical protein
MVYQSALGTLAEYLGDPEVQSIKAENPKAFMLYLYPSYKPERPPGNLDPLSTASNHRYGKFPPVRYIISMSQDLLITACISRVQVQA